MKRGYFSISAFQTTENRPSPRMKHGYFLIAGYETRIFSLFQTCLVNTTSKTQHMRKKLLGCESGDQVLLIHEKNQSSKISCYSPCSYGTRYILKRYFKRNCKGFQVRDLKTNKNTNVTFFKRIKLNNPLLFSGSKCNGTLLLMAKLT